MKDQFNPESLMMSYGYKPELSEGAAKTPIFQISKGSDTRRCGVSPQAVPVASCRKGQGATPIGSVSPN